MARAGKTGESPPTVCSILSRTIGQELWATALCVPDVFVYLGGFVVEE